MALLLHKIKIVVNVSVAAKDNIKVNNHMGIIEISGKACLKTREIWEEVFYEDSKKFTDYYFQEKACDNKGYIVDEDIKSMMFRTPYETVVYGNHRRLSYIVGVATRKQYRHKGMMTALLTKAFRDMYKEREPFTFLMPANPAIYEPFDFEYVYSRDIWSLRDGVDYTYLEDLWQEYDLKAAGINNILYHKKNGIQGVENISDFRLKSVRSIISENEQSDIFEDIAAFANEILENKYEIYIYRNEKYYRRQLKELVAQNGDIFIAMNGKNIEGIFLYAREGEIAIQEVIERKEGIFPFLVKKSEKKDIIMARIIHLEEMLSLIRSKERKCFTMKVTDPILKENDGFYKVESGPRGGTVTKLSDIQPGEECISMKELAPKLLQNLFINEIV